MIIKTRKHQQIYIIHLKELQRRGWERKGEVDKGRESHLLIHYPTATVATSRFFSGWARKKIRSGKLFVDLPCGCKGLSAFSMICCLLRHISKEMDRKSDITGRDLALCVTKPTPNLLAHECSYSAALLWILHFLRCEWFIHIFTISVHSAFVCEVNLFNVFYTLCCFLHSH